MKAALSANAQEFVPIWLNQNSNPQNQASFQQELPPLQAINVNPYHHQNYNIPPYAYSHTPVESTTPIALQIPQNYIISTSPFPFIPQPISIHAQPATQINFTTPAQLMPPSPPLMTQGPTNYMHRPPIMFQPYPHHHHQPGGFIPQEYHPHQQQSFQQRPYNNKSKNKNQNRKFQNTDNVNNNNNNTMCTSQQQQSIPKIMNKIPIAMANRAKTNKSNVQLELDNESEFPSLSGKEQESTAVTEEKPVVLSETQKMMIKNVNFLKTQVEQFYKTENENNYKRQQQNQGKLSFKEALEKPLEVETKASKSKKTVEKANTKQSNEAKAAELEPSMKPLKEKSKKSKKKVAIEIQKEIEEFNLNKDDFPDINDPVDGKKKYSRAESTHSGDDSSMHATGNKDSSNASIANTKKSNRPIVIEFANMISALEKVQQEEKRHVTKPKFNEMSSKKSSASNPLDASAQSTRRGKEREKPKTKKPSTLKKIILKEREEKKRNRQLKNQGTSLGTSSVVSVDSTGQPKPQKDETPENEEKLEEEEVDNENEESSEENSASEEEDEEEEEDDDDEENENDEDNGSSKKNAKNNTDATSDANDFASEDYTSNQMSPISQGSPLSIGGYTPGISPYTVASVEPLSPAKLAEQVKDKIHSKRFREYCNQIVNKEIDAVCTALLQEIVRFQDRMYHKNPLKAKMRRRYVMGIREVTKHLKLKKVKCIILAPNCEKIQSKGGLDEAINRIIEYSIEQNVPFVFALGRKGLGKAVNKLVPISVIGIFDFSGAEQHFKRLVELADNARSAYNEMVYEYENEERKTLMMKMSHIGLSNYSLNSMNPTIPAHLGHSRTASNGSNISIDPALINYRTHSRTPSGSFNFLSLNNNPSINSGGGHHVGGHSRSASGGGGGTLNIDILSFVNHKHLTHSRNASNCSNISFVSRLSEPISEVGMPIGATINSTTGIFNVTQVTLPNSNATIAAVQYYSEQVRNEMRECDFNKEELKRIKADNEDEYFSDNSSNNTCHKNLDEVELDELEEQDEVDDAAAAANAAPDTNNNKAAMHLTCIDEFDAGNEADVDEDEDTIADKKRSRLNSKCNSTTTANSDTDSNLQQKLSKLTLNPTATATSEHADD